MASAAMLPEADGADDAIAGLAAQGLGAFGPAALANQAVFLQQAVGERQDQQDDGFGDGTDHALRA